VVSYQRLEFLGDAVLDLLVSLWLMYQVAQHVDGAPDAAGRTSGINIEAKGQRPGEDQVVPLALPLLSPLLLLQQQLSMDQLQICCETVNVRGSCKVYVHK